MNDTALHLLRPGDDVGAVGEVFRSVWGSANPLIPRELLVAIVHSGEAKIKRGAQVLTLARGRAQLESGQVHREAWRRGETRRWWRRRRQQRRARAD